MVRIDNFEFDATIRQEHSSEAEVTEYPVEQGADPADHSRRRPDTVSFDAVISATPAHLPPPSVIVRDARGQPVGGGWGAPGLNTRVRDAYAYLRNLLDTAQLVTVTTTLHVYKNMVCTSVRPTRDSKTGDALAFTASFKSVRIVTNLIEKPTKDLRGKGKTKLQKQPTSKTPAELEKPGSVLHDLFLGDDAEAHG